MRKTLAIAVFSLAVACWVVAQTPGQEQITNGPTVESVTSNSAVIAWSTNAGGGSIVKYGTDQNNLNQTAQSPYEKGGGTHRVTLKNLQPGTTYYYQVVSAQGQGTGTQAQSQVGQFTTSGQGQAAGAGGTKVPLYRAYNPSTGNHLFTDSYKEEQNAITKLGYKAEGIDGYLDKTQRPGTEPLYRLRGPNGDHLYTTNPAQRQQALQQGYKDEGVAGYVSASAQPNTAPLYGMVDPKNGEHFYTTSATERQQDISKGWKDEGVIGYVWNG